MTVSRDTRLSAVEKDQKSMESRLEVHDDALHRLTELSAGLEREIKNNKQQISRIDEAVNTLHNIATTVATKADIASLRKDVMSSLGDAHNSVSVRIVSLFVSAIVAVALVGIAASVFHSI